MRNQNLIVFDIDGTLTDTFHVDMELFYKAISENLIINNLIKTWEDYKYSTDSGFLLEICEQNLKRLPTDDENKKIQNHFHMILKDHFNKTTCLPVPGAREIFLHIQSLNDWHIAIATGAWQQSALIKLSAANIPHKEIPLASGNDHIERSEIINIAIKRAKGKYQIGSYNHIVYVGDRKWDLLAAKKLNIGFIGIGENIKKIAEEHHPEISDNIMLDYSDWKSFIGKLKKPEKLKLT